MKQLLGIILNEEYFQLAVGGTPGFHLLTWLLLYFLQKAALNSRISVLVVALEISLP